jgi:P27 family predicted phage terminase small subunit
MPRPRTSVGQKTLHGNPGKRDLHVPKPPPGVPDRPEWLKGEASEEWGRVVPILDSMGVLSRLDRAVIADYCRVWGMLVKVETELENTNLMVKGQKDELVRNPLFSVANQLRQRFHKCCDLIGLSPGTRSKLDVSDKSADEDPHGLLD